MSGGTGSRSALLRWLGPWTADGSVPSGIAREPWLLREGHLHGLRAFEAGAWPEPGRPSRLDAYVYTPRRAPVGLWVVSPGLHFAGPDDPRFDRFCRVLATAGFVVVAPFLPAYVDLRVSPTAITDLEAVVEAAAARFPELGTPSLFSISFGSFPALEVAARRPELVDGVVTFGGYADFRATVRFCVTGRMRTERGDVLLPRDPLNQPALFLNILRFLEVPGDTLALERAWSVMCYRTWGRMELKAPGRLDPFVEALVDSVPASQRELFRIGCGNRPGAEELLERALARGHDALDYLSASHALATLRRPVVVCHGKDDDVIPWNEATKLHAALVGRAPTELLLTGLFAHTGEGSAGPLDALREAGTLLRIVGTLASGGRLRERVRAGGSGR